MNSSNGYAVMTAPQILSGLVHVLLLSCLVKLSLILSVEGCPRSLKTGGKMGKCQAGKKSGGKRPRKNDVHWPINAVFDQFVPHTQEASYHIDVGRKLFHLIIFVAG